MNLFDIFIARQIDSNDNSNSIPQGNLWDYLTTMKFSNTLSGDVVVTIPDTCTDLTSAFESHANITTLTINGSGQKLTTLARTFYKAKISVIYFNINSANVTNFSNMSRECTNLISIIGAIDFTKASNVGYAFADANKLVDLKFVKETLKISITIPSAKLSAESIQSIIDGLATVETQQKLSLNSVVLDKLTTEQYSTISEKNWIVE